jgi:hypothetical protein
MILPLSSCISYFAHDLWRCFLTTDTEQVKEVGQHSYKACFMAFSAQRAAAAFLAISRCRSGVSLAAPYHRWQMRASPFGSLSSVASRTTRRALTAKSCLSFVASRCVKASTAHQDRQNQPDTLPAPTVASVGRRLIIHTFPASRALYCLCGGDATNAPRFRGLRHAHQAHHPLPGR